MRRMLTHLRNIGFPLKKDKPESTLSNTMGLLAKKGKLSIVKRGVGRMGTIYQWKGAVQQPDKAVPAAEPDQPADGQEKEAAD